MSLLRHSLGDGRPRARGEGTAQTGPRLRPPPFPYICSHLLSRSHSPHVTHHTHTAYSPYRPNTPQTSPTHPPNNIKVKKYKNLKNEDVLNENQ